MPGSNDGQFPVYRPGVALMGTVPETCREVLLAVADLFFIQYVEVDTLSDSRADRCIGVLAFHSYRTKSVWNDAGITEADMPTLVVGLNQYRPRGSGMNATEMQWEWDHIHARSFRISCDEDLFGPLKQSDIDEEDARELAAWKPRACIEPLITCGDRTIFGRTGRLYFTSVPLPGLSQPFELSTEFSNRRFMGLLPLFAFLRKCLGDQMFRPQRIGACCIIDDPNLRFTRYGFLRFGEAVERAEKLNFHMAIAMVPIDYGLAGKETVRLFDDKKNVLSGLIHGVNHLREELLVTPPGIQMENLLEKAIWCMNEFTTATNLPWSRAVVPPHEGVNASAVAAMGEKGFEALFVHPPYALHSIGIRHPLLTMFPSEHGFGELPIVDRLSLEYHYWKNNPGWINSFLFHAWLGKPIVPWTHHYMFKRGWDYFEDKIKFINNKINPEWMPIGRLLNNNFTISVRNDKLYVNLYSRNVLVNIPDNVSKIVISKIGIHEPARSSHLKVGDIDYTWDRISDNYVSASIPSPGPMEVEICTLPHPNVPKNRPRSSDYKAVFRRRLVEIRDRMRPYIDLGSNPKVYGPYE
ncbi:MAG: hypothetical protein ABFD98_05280 [Syntrophobacteraceae bacterium]|nr:hypothetical protein [Desulfobacteraceae bacterium]